MPLDVKVWPTGYDTETRRPEHAPIEVEDVDYVSFVSSPGGTHGGTYGKPPIIAPGTDNYQEGEIVVLFLNPANIVAAEVTKT